MRNLELDPNPVPPDIVVNGPGEFWLGDRQVTIAALDGHSSGTDLVVYVPDEDVLIAGDLLFVQRIPYLADGNIQTWQDSLERLANTYPTATVLPGHGPVSEVDAFASLADYLNYLETLALGWKTDGLSQEEALEQTSIAEEYRDYLFQGLFPGNLEVAYQQITAGQNDAASIQAYAAQQPQELQAL